MAIDAAKLNERLGRFVTDLDEARYVTATDRSRPGPIGTSVIDPTGSSASFAWRKLRLWTVTGRLHCFGVIHLDDLPPAGVIEFEQPSGLPVLTIALDPASVEPHDTDLDTMLGGPGVGDVMRHRWWTLRSESLEVLPSGAWRVMATLTATGNPGLVELRLEVDPKASSATGWCCEDGAAGSTRLRDRQSGLHLPQDPARPGRAGQASGEPHPHPVKGGSTCTTSIPG